MLFYGFSWQALDLKKLQTPLYEEFYNTVNAGSCQEADQTSKGKTPASPKLPPRGKSPQVRHEKVRHQHVII